MSSRSKARQEQEQDRELRRERRKNLSPGQLSQKELDRHLLEAAEEGNEAEARALVEAGARGAAANGEGETALHVAAQRGDEGLVRLLLPVSDPNARQRSGWTPLMEAVHRRHPECASLLLPASDLAALNDAGLDALMMAAFAGSEKCVALLLPVSDPSRRDHDQMTALMWAAHSRIGSSGPALLLLPASDANAQDKGGRTALLHAVGLAQDLAMIRALLAASDLSLVDHRGRDALALAAEKNAPWIVNEVMREKAEREARQIEAAAMPRRSPIGSPDERAGRRPKAL
jgi:ankyrin repeat protein